MVNYNEDFCVGCEACSNICPVDCITMIENKRGFLVPSINLNICISCGQCERVCPSISINSSNNNKTIIFAACNYDKTERYNSTSGGVFSAIAKEFIDEGGFVAAAVYDVDNNVKYLVSNELDDIEKFRQSKYVQSEKGDVYKRIRDILKEGNKLLFCGCPCDIAALKNYIGNNYIGQLLLIDFICLGVNSRMAYRSYLNELEKKYSSKISRVWFKNKSRSWNLFGTRVEFDNGKTYYKDRYHDPFMRSYLEKPLIIRKSCERCKYKSIPHVSDIMLGDFWGIEHLINIDTHDGVSLVCCNSKKGLKILKRISDKVFFVRVSEKDAFLNNPMAQQSVKLDESSDDFLNTILSEDYSEAVNDYIPRSRNESIHVFVKSMIVWIKNEVKRHI